MVQELWELFQLDDDLPELQSDMEASSDHLFLAISKAAINGISATRIVRFSGSIQHIPVSILVDSGSSISFISCQLAAQLSGVQKLQAPVPVQVAGGNTLSCTSVLAQAQWFIGEVSFQFDLKVLPLTAYDIIICMDWLEAFSPMTVHWQQKWMQISYEGQSVLLQGELPVQLDNLLIQVCVLTDSVVQQSELSLLPLDIRLLVDQFGELFEEPSELPPSRACDHDIPLIPGARPVNIRPYRYPPALRDEIEKQVADMLQKGLMQPSSSSFSSPILLVKKKDGSYRFCVDFRHLNALTMKSKFPVSVFDQLMDELASASWFSNFDLWAGFHQILLKPGEEFKTAFQTHFGQFEFRVMAFGLTGAPGSFQGAMNAILAPGLRKFVIVFFDDILVYNRSYEEHLDHIRQVFEWLSRDQWELKFSKCKFAQRSISYLGHIISEQGVATDPAKVEAVLSWPTPSSVKELCSFLGLAGYYRKFVRHFGILARPFTNLLKKNTMFVWTAEHDEAFSALKTALSSAPVLALPDFSVPFAIETDACANGAKPDRARYPGLLQPLPVLSSAWEMVSLDFVEGLPRLGNSDTILVVVDKYSKFAHFIPLRHPFTALSVAKAFLDHVYKLHGLPSSLVSDRDRVFTSNLWKELFALAGAQLQMSSAYHLQMDGQTERVNQCMETYMRCFVHACPTKWSSWLSLAEFWYNTSSHSTLGRSPFEVLYGHSPHHFGIVSALACSASDLSDWLHEREIMHNLVREHLIRAQDRMKRQADKGRSERVFQVGDRVYLKLQPYVQSSLAPRANQKLSFKFFGPYSVVERIG
ncbi:uncharacterized protein LOC120674480 [Panicum virgatum]|uniref:uncharacterized protein LOC120674480 n=1 Tax=Panicum virgatum TaxID=38727 RepID=UPI0019D67D62|nr:uncharacterized protein LOC120674480 [Panicum virgatum]